jgi:uncharacterized protein
MILEGIVTTINVDGSVNISPMGPIVDPDMTRLTLRPYETSTTLQNLLRTKQGVFHVTDDVELLARAAVDRLEVVPPLVRAASLDGWILADACRWYAFEVRETDTREPRARLEAAVVDRGRLRDFFGLNRAKHAVVEAAILATRLGFLPIDEVLVEMRRLAVLVEKTGGPAEHRAFRFLGDLIQAAASSSDARVTDHGSGPTASGIESTP